MAWFSRKKKQEKKDEAFKAENDSYVPLLNEVDLSEIRVHSISACESAGFKPAKSLPTIKEMELRPAIEIAKRLHALKALVLWLMVPESDLPDEKIIAFIARNDLNAYLTPVELRILQAARDEEALRNAIGWKFENAWPLAWYFGYDEPDHAGQMMPGERMQEILMHHTCALDGIILEWVLEQETLSEEQLLLKEDLYYCIHNAVRSAQLGGETVPNGFDPIRNGGVIHERRHALTWMLSKNVEWNETDLST